MNRRQFLVMGIWGGIGGGPRVLLQTRASSPPSEMKADVVIIGGGVGGCAAALAAARNGLRVIMTEETDWIGGQFTAQAVPPDEHPWIEAFGSTRSYREFRERVRDYYRRHYPLTAEARARWDLNPGNGHVSRLCHEPRVALAVLYEMFAPHMSQGRLELLLQHKAVAADTERDRVLGVQVRSLVSGREVVLRAPYFVDATELGDLLPLTGTEYVTGAEAQSETGEPHAPVRADPTNVQAFTFCFAMDYVEGEDHTIEKPREYEFWKTYRPQLRPAWPGRLLDWWYSDPVTLRPRRGFLGVLGSGEGEVDLWAYRRIIDRRNFAEGAYASDITLVNWPQNDYWLGSLIDVPEEEAARHRERAKQLSLSLLYWLQTEAPRPDGRMGYRGLSLRKDLVGTEDGLAKYPYVRESRRIRAEFTVLEQHVSTQARMRPGGEEVTAEHFPDSIGIGSYRIDLHPSTGGDNYIDLSTVPFEIPLGAVIPQRVENLLPASKNIGTTHITNGCFRVHHVEWNVGESVGELVAFCVAKKMPPRQVRRDVRRRAEFQEVLQARGIELRWPRLGPR